MPAIAFLVKESLSWLIKVVTTPRNIEYDILQSEIKMPGRMINLKLLHNVTKHEYNLTVYYAPQVKSINKTQMINIAKTFSQVHDIFQNNIIIGDFNFADKDVDKGRV